MPVTFDFISDERFRKSLRQDYDEMLACLQCSAWKSVHVLAGSIIEAILIDYLIASGYPKKANKDVLKLQLNDAIDICLQERILSEKAANLSTVVRQYRNLIHPGRVIRLGEKVDQNGALIAKALVDLVVDEIVTTKKERYGFTAEQLLSKIERDSSAMSILSHLLNETPEVEREKLLIELLPKRSLECAEEPPFAVADYGTCFREVFESLGAEDRKRRVAHRMVEILRNGDHREVMDYQSTFFRARDLVFLSDTEKNMVKQHLLAQIDERELTTGLYSVLDGIHDFLTDEEFDDLVDTLIRILVGSKNATYKKNSNKALWRLWMASAGEREKALMGALTRTAEYYEDHDAAKSKLLRELADSLQIPF